MKQLSFGARRRRDGKVRQKPGPKPGVRTPASHGARPEARRWIPMHLTMRALAGLPSFRQPETYPVFEEAVRKTRRTGFRIVEYSVQSDHLHLVAEADSKESLAGGMKSFAVRATRLFNIATGRRRGPVWRDRYHRRDLTSPRQVRNALVYCLNNARKHHAISLSGLVIDACSSAPWFDGWSLPRSAAPSAARPTELPRTALLRWLWRKHGLIHPLETPNATLRVARPHRSLSRWS